MPPSAHSARADLERLRGASGTAGDASPFRTAMRNIIAACRNSPLALASYCQQGVLPALAAALQQPQVMSSTQLGTCVLEVALCLTQQLIDETKVTDGSGSSYAVGESVMARRLDGEFGEGTVVDALGDSSYLVVWNEEEAQAAKLDAAELMPFGSGMGLSTERRQRVAPAFILNNFLTKTAIPSNDLSRVQMVVRDGADVNCTDSEGNSPLNLAASSGASVALIQFLISRGAHVNFVGAAGTALQIAGSRGQLEVVKCLLAHGADPAVVDLEACTEEAQVLLREAHHGEDGADDAAQAPLSAGERAKYASDAFVHLVPALLTCLGSTQSPKLHKRLLMLLSLLVQRSTAAQLKQLSPLQLGALLGALRALLAAPQPLEQFCSLRMLGACLSAWPPIASTARRHGLELLLARLAAGDAPADPPAKAEAAAAAAAATPAAPAAPAATAAAAAAAAASPAASDAAATATAAAAAAAAAAVGGAAGAALLAAATGGSAAAVAGGGGGGGSRARSSSLKSSDVAEQAGSVLGAMRAVAVAADEGSAQSALVELAGMGDFGAAARRLAALLLGAEAPSSHELAQSGTLAWLLRELGSVPAGSAGGAAALRGRWRDFEAAFGTQPGAPGGAALAQLLQLLHNTLAAAEHLPVHSYSSSGEGPYSLKPLSEPIQICLHPLGGSQGGSQGGEGEAEGAPALQLSIDPLVRMRELQLHLLRTSSVNDTAYEAFGTRLLGCVVDERPLGGAPDAPLRRATVTAMRTATPLRLTLHTLRYDAPAAAGEAAGAGEGGSADKGGEEAEVVLATREYRIVGRVSDGELSRLRGLSTAAAAGTVADPEARVHTVSVLCPEGLPVELFLDNVMSEVRRALRQAESGAAPMTRSVGEDYGWRDRGWERGGSQFERTLTEKLREHGVGAVARRQTSREAEVLMARLQNTVMALSAVETPEEEEDEGGEADEASERWTLLARVQGLVAAERPNEQAQWVSATVVDTSGSGPQCSLVYDDGRFEAAVPAYRVRPVPMPEVKRVNPLALIFMSFEQFLSSRDERRVDTDANGRESVPANLRRTLSAFHIGRVQTVGHVSRERLSNADTAAEADGGGGGDDDEVELMDTSGDGEGDSGGHARVAVPSAAAAAASELPAFDIAPMPLQVRFTLGPASGGPAEAGAPSLAFDDERTLLHSLQQLREANQALGLESAAVAPQELGFHPGVTCDRTGQCPIIGNRYKLAEENYDVCEAEFVKMSQEEAAAYTRVPPPCFRKLKGHGPAVWHLWYSVQVAADGGEGGGEHKGLAEGGEGGASAAASPSAAASAGGEGGGGGGVLLPWSCQQVEEQLLSGGLEAAAVLREVRRAAAAAGSACEARLGEAAARVLATTSGGREQPPASQLMALCRELSDAPRAVPAPSPPLPPPGALCELREELRHAVGAASGDGGDREFSDAALLLWLLSHRLLRDDALAGTAAAGAAAGAAGALTAAAAEEEGSETADSEGVGGDGAPARRHFVSTRLSAKLLQQLSDALAVASGALPLWCRLLVRACPHLFTPRARQLFFRATAFGTSRALHWVQEQQVASVRAAYAEELAALERARIEAEVSNDPQALAEVVEQLSEIEDRVSRERLGALKSDIARVQRDELLPQAQRLMRLHARSCHQLEIQFEGESGFGTGVTQNFYSAVANALLTARAHAELPLWLADTTTSAGGGGGGGGSDPANDGFINHGGSLFPLPLPPDAERAHVLAVCERFRFLGRLTAKACRDSFIVPLPLSLHFLHLSLRGGTLSYAALPAVGATGGVASGYASLAAELAAIDERRLPPAEARRAYAQVGAAEFSRSRLRMGAAMSFDDWVEAGSCTFTCPVTGAPLCTGGDAKPLTVHNLQEYTHLLAQLWLAEGVQRQATAFREGLEEVFPASALSPFSLGELQALLCGTMRIEWGEAELQRHIHPSGGYTKHSKVYQLLIDELQRMGNGERRAFLNFVTACPHLPPVGLSTLEIEVIPQQHGAFPTAQTCGNKLCLPDYDTPEALRTGLAEAFANADYGGLHEVGGLH